ncbi:iron ABC transporter permease [Nocardioides sp. 616]|uniref:FecCD family ABC transporter permease n=1 Tax=Nocardioides sp. 616 TaxID=2268090 RepID=UPI001F05D2B0|nr:iron ABC transporter permease [Nocardioides sp. 616]
MSLSLPLAPTATNRTLVLGVLGVALLASMVFAAGAGQLHISAGEVVGSLLHKVGIDAGSLPSHPQGESSLWRIRFPRIAMAVMVGAALGVAGAVMQGVFGNPLAEPGVVGVSAGAALAASAVIVFDVVALGSWTLPVGAFLGGLVTTIAVYLLSRQNGRTEVVTLVLTGVAINAMAGGALAFLMFLGDTSAREEIVFWQLGSLNGARVEQVLVTAPLAVAGIAVSLVLARRLDLLALGDKGARHVGVNVERLRMTCIVVVAVLTAAAVAFAGIIAFVGLIIPHLMRMVVGPGHRALVPASALGGAVLLVLADLWARTAIAYADLPIGMLTSVVGGPVFFWLLRRARRTAGGWA